MPVRNNVFAGAVQSLDYQPGLDGLRAFAVILVVLYHGRIRGFSNGAIGVDIFFVLSGLLITTLLLVEMSRTGRLFFGSFYIRRARRLLPAYRESGCGCRFVRNVALPGRVDAD